MGGIQGVIFGLDADPLDLQNLQARVRRVERRHREEEYAVRAAAGELELP